MRTLDHQRFHVDQLEQHAVAVVTQAFLRAPRGDKARLGTARRVFRHSPLVHRSSPFAAPAAPLGVRCSLVDVCGSVALRFQYPLSDPQPSAKISAAPFYPSIWQ